MKASLPGVSAERFRDSGNVKRGQGGLSVHLDLSRKRCQAKVVVRYGRLLSQ